MNTKFVHGWLPDLPDHRDLRFSPPIFETPTPLPNYLDLTDKCPPVYDQGQLGSCTANALGAAIEFLQKKQDPNYIFTNPSRLFIYYNERVIEHSVRSDSGAQIRDGIKTLAKQGVCAETLWPYDIERFAVHPLVSAYAAAKKLLALKYERVNNLSIPHILGALALGNPVVLGFTVYESFESEAVDKSGILPMPGKTEQVLGGHAVMAVGYDNTKRLLKIRNSWGPKWGQSGYFWMPYAYASDPNLADDFWTISQVS